MATLHFKGKSAVWNHHLSVPYHTLEKDDKKSLKGKNSDENLIIEGDNLLALKSLLPQYQGRVKCIYIDPPYNTGNEGWVYSDNVSSPVIKNWLGHTVGKEGEDLTRHDKWLCMMTPRLKLLQELLSDNGIILVSIDDVEFARLKALMDEIFGETNFLANLIWKSRQIVDSRNINKISNDHEYILAYSKQSGAVFRGRESDVSKYSNPDDDSRGPWMSNSILGLANAEQRPNLHYNISDPVTGIEYACPPESGWRYSKETMQRKISDDRIIFPKKENGRPREKKFLAEIEDKFTGFSTILDASVGYTLHGTREVRELLNEDNQFQFPKPVSLIKTLIEQVTDEGDVILDSFAGSGTTAQAVMELNMNSSTPRSYILVEMEEYAGNKTAERVRQAAKAKGSKEGFAYQTLGPSIDAETILTGELPTFTEFAKYVYYLATGKNHPKEKDIKDKEGFVGKSEHESIYLLYEKDMDKLKKLAITLSWARETNKKDPGKKIVYAPACYLDDELLAEFSIKFVSIPYNLFEHKK